MTPLLLALTLAAPVPKDFKKPVATLNGKWRFVGTETDGRKVPIGDIQQLWHITDGNTLVIDEVGVGARPPRAIPIPIRTDAKATPKQVEFVGDGNRLAIYEVTADRLVICKAMNPGVRPGNVAGGAGMIRWEFTRVPKK